MIKNESTLDLPAHIAKHFKEVHFGGNWTSSNLKDILEGISWQEATTKVSSLNTIATLVFHMNYYVSAVLKVLKGEQLVAKDTYSFNHPPINSEDDWNKMLVKTFEEADAFSKQIALTPEDLLWKNFTDEKYGIYYRNLHGIIEHCHYHLGQIAVLKKLVQKSGNKLN